MTDISTDSDPLDELERAARALEQVPDRRAREWLSICLAELAEGQDPRPALGLASQDFAQLKKSRRNYWLVQAYGLIPGNNPTERCQALATAASRFEAIVWPRWRDRQSPPEDASNLHACLFRARKADLLPGFRQLFNIVYAMVSV